jgi:hypothetical protein
MSRGGFVVFYIRNGKGGNFMSKTGSLPVVKKEAALYSLQKQGTQFVYKDVSGSKVKIASYRAGLQVWPEKGKKKVVAPPKPKRGRPTGKKPNKVCKARLASDGRRRCKNSPKTKGLCGKHGG